MRLPNRFGFKSHGSVVRVCVAEGVAMIVRVQRTTHLCSTEAVCMDTEWKMYIVFLWCCH